MQKAVRYLDTAIPSMPCADISYAWTSILNITMHFARVMGGFESDLSITFEHPFAFQWEKESFGLIALPSPIPQCEHPNFRDWTYPILIFHNSPWADQYAAHFMTDEEFQVHKIQHFIFISMNDVCHILSLENPRILVIKEQL
ncbi:hypothetical protein ACSYAD_07625 [Acaryochloris marina NIES-2412]|uniref:hypothetical protein n=1 Tax=Acaryochloris marina TaxID=155978 RepID=UPI004057CFED